MNDQFGRDPRERSKPVWLSPNAVMFSYLEKKIVLVNLVILILAILVIIMSHLRIYSLKQPL